MASAAEQLAANLNFGAFAKATELQKRIWFTLGALVVYRLGTYVPLPGIDPVAFASTFSKQQGGILGMFNMLAGGAVERMAVFALNIMPYISASIIVQLMTTAIPSWEKLKKEGESGRKQLNQYTRWLTVALAVFQGYGIAVGLENSAGVVSDPGLFFRASTVITLLSGTMFVMWLGEQITARGVGNGSSLIIFVGIVASLPRAVLQTLELGRTGNLNVLQLLVIIAIVIGVIFLIVFIEFQGDSSFLPLKINTAGVIPPIFASSLLLLPHTFASFNPDATPSWMQAIVAAIAHGQPGYMIAYSALIIFFCFFYTSVVFNPEETADNLRKYGGFLPGIRPGKKTSEYLDYVLTRLTVIGALYITLVCLLPEFLISYYKVPFYLGGTSLLIVVSVTMDTVSQMQSHLLAHQYEGLIKRSKLRGKDR
jgi:preprotein translocase subunit SecY